MKRSRRGFLKLAAAGAAAVAIRPARSLATAAAAPAAPASAPRRKARAGSAGEARTVPPPELRAEIERQKRELEKTLKTLRDFPLDPGSEPAFVFRPLPPARHGKP